MPINHAIQQKYKNKFAEALSADRRTSNHAFETNCYAIDPIINLLRQPELPKDMCLEKIIWGSLNFILMYDNSKYHFIGDNRNLAKADKKLFANCVEEWHLEAESFSLEQYNDYIIHMIKQASKSPLFLSSFCCPNTRGVFQEYLSKVAPSMTFPNIDENCTKFSPEMDIKVMYKQYTTENELNRALYDLNNKIQGLDALDASEAGLAAAVELKTKVFAAVEEYQSDNTSNFRDKRTNFETKVRAAFDKAEPTLSKEFGWGDWLANLFRQFMNAVIKVSNQVTGSKFTLFEVAQTNISKEFNACEKDLSEIEQMNVISPAG